MEKKVVVITGASGGIGAALAIKLGRQGHQLVLAARREKELQGVAKQAGDQVVPVICDVCHRHEVEYLREAALKAFKQVDVWVNNAGRGITKPVLQLTDDEFDEMMQVNVKSSLYGMQAIVPHFQARGAGHLINVSSFLARVPLASFRSAYNAAKAALNALTANLRMDLAGTHPDIHVSLVMPGVVLNDFSKHALGGTPQFTGARGAMQGQTSEEAAAIIAGLIESPKAEIYTNPASADLCRRYYEDVAAFEAGLRNRT